MRACVRRGRSVHPLTHVVQTGDGASSTEPDGAKTQIGAERIEGATDTERLNGANSPPFDFNRRKAKPNSSGKEQELTAERKSLKTIEPKDFLNRITRRFILVICFF